MTFIISNRWQKRLTSLTHRKFQILTPGKLYFKINEFLLKFKDNHCIDIYNLILGKLSFPICANKPEI